MKQLIIQETRSTPGIDLNPQTNTLRIQGQSYPENAFKFYEPIFEWVDGYLRILSTETNVVLELKLPYVNTSSIKCLMMLLDKFEQSYLSGKRIAVNWYYNEENESELECAEEFQEDLSLPMRLIPLDEG